LVTAVDDCRLGAGSASIDRANGSVDFGMVGPGASSSWDDVECVTGALEMPREYLTELQRADDELEREIEESRWGAYMVLRMRSGGETDISVYHDWQAPLYKG
jgi:hypothetical protein